MKRERQQVSSDQIQFFLTEEGVRLSTQVGEGSGGKIISEFLPARRLWKETPDGNILLVKVDSRAEAFVIDPSNWREINSVNLSGRTENLKFCKAIIVFSSSLTELGLSRQKALFVTVSSMLDKKGGGLFVIEELGPDEDESWRNTFLDDLDLVRHEFYTSKKSERKFVWGARRSKPGEKPEPRDLTDRSYPKSGLVIKLWKEMVANYHKDGYKLYEAEKSALFKRLKASTNPYYDMQYIKAGLGVNLIVSCGCVWEVDFSGEWKGPNPHCSDPDCDGTPKVVKKQETWPVYNLKLKETVLNEICGEPYCKQNYRASYRLVRKIDNKAVLIENVSCPSCGLIRTRRLNVDKRQLIE